MKLVIDLNEEKRLCRFVSAVIFSVFLTNLLSGFAVSFGFDSSLFSLLIKGFIGVMFLFIVPIIYRRINKHILVFILAAIFIAFFNSVLFPDLNVYFADTVFTFFTFCLPVYITCYLINDYKALFREIIATSLVIAIFNAIFLFLMFSGICSSFNNGKYSMGLGYSCAIPGIFLLIDAFQNKRIKSFVGFLLIVITIISFGSRGPLIELFVFALYFSIRYLVLKKKYVLTFAVILIFAILGLTYKRILTTLLNLGFQSRVIRTLTSDTIYLSGRDVLYERLFPLIKENPFAIRGINAEWQLLGVYAHNFILEIVFQFGIAIGGIIIGLIFYRFFRTTLFKVIDYPRILCIAFMFACFPQMFISSSIWTNYVFWIWMAMFSSISRKQNRII